MAEKPAIEGLREIDDDTLLDMYEDARAEEDHERCDAVSAELHFRGIEVTPCSGVPGADGAAARSS